jgi:hypothetical protein
MVCLLSLMGEWSELMHPTYSVVLMQPEAARSKNCYAIRFYTTSDVRIASSRVS